MATETLLPADRASVQEMSRRMGEPAWLTELRLEALDAAARLDLPKLEKTRLERWNIDAYGRYQETSAVESAADLPAEALRYVVAESPNNLVVQRNSGAAFRKLSDDLAKRGVIFTDFATAVREHEDLVKPYFMSVVRADEHRLSALHAALFTGGVFLYVPKNITVEEPLQALFITDDSGAAFSPHILIVAESGSSVTYVDNVISAGEGGAPLVHNSITEIVCKPGASVRYASVHHLGRETTDLSWRRARLDNDARVEWIIGEMNAGDTVSDTHTILQGTGSSSEAKVICVGTGDQKLNITTRAVHFGKKSQSDMLTRAVMRDEATAIINGITKIEKGATDANGEQTERVLMLSPRARGDANPMLLIDEDEVKAGHAASVGQVNKEQVYYLMSRGISREDAMKLIIYGFLAPIVTQIPIQRLETLLSEVVERKLGQRS